MTTKIRGTAPDQVNRDAALDTVLSCIVQAPAGSGKTELLTQRFLRLLARVDEPEEILAITFTRAATAEMRSRILNKLAEAQAKPKQANEDPSLTDARAALKHSEARGWNLLEQPQRLNIQTIDSLCMRIAHGQPLLARMGGLLQPIEIAQAFYEEAARRTLANLGSTDPEIHSALQHLLELRDNNLQDAERLIADMLARRDQWLHNFPQTSTLSEDDWSAIRLQLEMPFKQAIRRTLTEAHVLLTREPVIANELIDLAGYACESGSSLDIAMLAGLKTIPDPDHGLVEHWKCIGNFLLTGKQWRKAYSTAQGFPSSKEKHFQAHQKPTFRMKRVVDHLRNVPELHEALIEIRSLPSPRYDEDQWQLLRDVFVILRYAVAELRVLFAQQNIVDFVELSVAALQVLGDEHPTDAGLKISDSIRHLLVDEFQDTSRRQHQLVQKIVRAWALGEARTFFLVGDPMQSIYAFRQAEVELFEHIQLHGIESYGQRHSLKPIELFANFRSHKGLTTPLNIYFDTIFAGRHEAGSGAVIFSRSQAVEPPLSGKSVHIHPQFVSKSDSGAEHAARESEADTVVRIVEEHTPQFEQAAANPDASYTVAVLARAKEHLALLAAKLRERGIPFRSVELEALADRQEIRDLLSLLRALLHPMDRVAWLSALRAPWCGLTLEDLHLLSGSDDKQFEQTPVQQLIAERQSLLSPDGRQRLDRVSGILKRALEVRYKQSESPSLASWLERTWHTLGGPHCLDATQRENARVFFSMLDAFAPDGTACLGNTLDEQLSVLYAQPDPQAGERFGVQLMTIHKAKGLGFEVVILPGLDRQVGRDGQPLIAMLERAGIENAEEEELLVAPIGSKGDEGDPIYKWVLKQRRLRESEERKRVFYVGCTRARRELHLLGTATVTDSGDLKPGSADSLLAAAWPALAGEFDDAFQEQKKRSVIPLPATPRQAGLDVAAAAAAKHPALVLRRLPADAACETSEQNVTWARLAPDVSDEREPFERPEGSRLQRGIGSIIHALLERLSRLPLPETPALRAWLEPLATALLRSAALPVTALSEILDTVEAVVTNPVGRWLLQPHPDAQSEVSWTGWVDGTLRTLRADRVFRAGSQPLSTGAEYIWVVDYKTTQHKDKGVQAFLAAERKRYEGQLTQYGKALRKLHGESLPLRYALYFPRLGQLDHWTD